MQHQWIEAEHQPFVMVAATLRLEHATDADMQGCQRTTVCRLFMQATLQAQRQGHLQQVVTGMSREPGLQIFIHPVCQTGPGAPVHQESLFGRDDIADDLRLDHSAHE